ncbi:MAG: glycosyltransferase family 4 protein [Thermomicrobia bacterium]|nr:glycosyltransferase family 4 protein [Thermomicrobia bacterium]
MRGKDSDRATSVLSPQSSVLPPVLRVAVDVTPAMTQGAGIGRVARHLARALPLLDRETQFTYLYATEGRDGVIPAGFLPVPHPPEDALRLPATAPGYGPGENVTFRRLPLPAAWMTRLWHRARLPVPVERFTGPVDCYHALDYVAPRVRHARLLVTVHDLSFLAVPQYAEPSLAAYLGGIVPGVVRRADLVLAVSAFTAREVVERLHIAPERVRIVPNGVEGRFRPYPPGERAEARVAVADIVGNADQPYLLAVGTLEPRKNYPTLLRAYARLRATGLPHTLVIAGRQGWQVGPIFETVQELHLAGQVRFGSPPDGLLPALYNAADAVIAPAWYEGFGLSVLEGMACGVPVVASDIPPHREVAGDVAWYADPGDATALAETITAALNADETTRATRRASGLARAATMGWGDAARALLRVYHGAS